MRSFFPPLFAFVALAAAGVAAYYAYDLGHYANQVLGNRATLQSMKYNDRTKAAIDVRLDQGRSLFQLGLLVTGALWGLVIAKPDETRILLRHWPEIVMFILANLALLAHFACYVLFTLIVSDAYAASGATGAEKNVQIADVLRSKAADFFTWQIYLLGLGLAIAMLTFLSAHRLRGQNA